ncbi:MAG: hypothetical protein KJ858_05075, partial [Nanoarchaeota archaeon]|nr:hypothetical protein [Nanoarchaeota archaeon]
QFWRINLQILNKGANCQNCLSDRISRIYVARSSFVLVMEQEVCMLPVKCKSCERVFDLWSVLQEQEQSSRVVSGSEEFRKLASQYLCQHCLHFLLKELADEEAELEEVEESDEEPQAEECPLAFNYV